MEVSLRGSGHSPRARQPTTARKVPLGLPQVIKLFGKISKILLKWKRTDNATATALLRGV
jgi:hypothetical protein